MFAYIHVMEHCVRAVDNAARTAASGRLNVPVFCTATPVTAWRDASAPLPACTPRCCHAFTFRNTVYALWITRPYRHAFRADNASVTSAALSVVPSLFLPSRSARDSACKKAPPFRWRFSLSLFLSRMLCHALPAAAASFSRTRSSRHSSTTSTFSRPKVSKMFLSASSAAGAGFLISDSIASSTVMGRPAACVSAAAICLSCPPLSMTLR